MVKLNRLGRDVFEHKDLISYEFNKTNQSLQFDSFYVHVFKGYKKGDMIDRINQKLCLRIFYLSKNYCFNQSSLYDDINFFQKKLDFYLGLIILSIVSFFVFTFRIILIIRLKKKNNAIIKFKLLTIFVSILLFFVLKHYVGLGQLNFNERVYGNFISSLDIQKLNKNSNTESQHFRNCYPAEH